MSLSRLLVLSAAFPAFAFALEPFQLSREDVAELSAKAPSAQKAKILTVVDKPQASASGDAHDYVSFARYYWPDPSKPDGLPYLSHDGHHNEAQVAKGDHERLWGFAEKVEALAAAWQTKHDDAAAHRAGEWLRAWFITPATRMNPNMEFAQVRLGHNNNHGNLSGVLDSRCFSGVIDALRMLHESPALKPAEEATIQAWFKSYLDWLTTAKNARDEHATKNNHGSWFLAQIIPIARYCGRDDLAQKLCEEDKARIANQIKADGSQPEEIRRVDGLGYSVFNLEAQFQVARLAQGLGLDLWHYHAADGASLEKAVEYLKPYNAKPDIWPASQNAKLKPGFLDKIIKEGEAEWK